MSGWDTSALSAAAQVFNGKTPSKSEQREEGHPVLKIRDVSELGKFRGPFRSFVDESLAAKYSSKRLQPGDTLILNAAHNADYVGSKTFHAVPAVYGSLATGEWLVIRPDSQLLDASFVHHWVRLDSTRREIKEVVNGIHLYPKDVARLRIPLPPLPEQRRIAAILDQADALRAKRREALAQLDSLTHSIFIEMFGDPATNPKRWPEVTISEICDVKGGKRLPKGEDYSMTPTPFRYIRVTDIRSGSVDESRLLFLRPEVQSTISRYIVNAGDVIISIAGSIGLIAPVSRKLAGANLTENAAKLVPRVTAPAYDHMFLAKALQTPFAQDQISSHVGQVTIGKLALFRIEKVRLPLPPIDAQREFAKRVDALAGLRHAHQTSNEVLDVLFASLQHRAFAGQLS